MGEHSRRETFMPRIVNEIDELSVYLNGVMDRSEHHADNVEDVVLTLADALVWRKGDSGTQDTGTPREHG